MKKTNTLLFAICLFFLTIRFIYHFNQPWEFKNGDKIRIRSQVVSEPVRYEYSQYIKLSGFKIYLPLYPEISYGDTITVEGRVEVEVEGFEIVGMNLLDLDRLRLQNPVLTKIEKNGGYLYRFRSGMLSVYRRNLPQPHSSLVAGVTIGSKSDIPASFWEKLKNSGTAHVVVASGMNVTLVAGFLMSFFLKLVSRRKAILFALIGIWLYAVTAGFDAPIVRAAVMGSITFAALGLGRLNDAKRALFISVFIMLIFVPDWAMDIGFWLSSVATASILYFQKPIKNIVLKLRLFHKLGLIREDLITTTAAQIGVAPILYFSFGQFNLLSPLINAAVLWSIPLITIIGMLGGLAGLIYVPLGNLVLYLSYPLTLWFIKIVEISG